ncbi:MAG TPA: hypothetical protein VIV12_04460, partial [Streptosporangiaceae bacterium]
MVADNQEVADVDILDITNPAAPVMASETGFNNWPAAQSPLANGDTVFNHDFQVKKIGTRWIALNSYWDAGWVLLDVTNPASPVFINDSDYRCQDHQRVSAIRAAGACAPVVPVSPGQRPVPASRFIAVRPARPGLTSAP